jgi:O-antigen/teichoic acid export membrane protein
MLYNGVAKVSLLLGNLVVLSIYSHYLGSLQFGIVALMNVVTAFYWLFFLGIPQTMIKQISHYLALDNPAEVQRAFSNGTLAILVLGTVICLGLTVAAPYIVGVAVTGYNGGQNNIEFVAYVTVASTFCYALYTPIDSALQGYQRYGTIAIRTLISTAFGWFLMVLAVWFDTGVRGVALATLGQPVAVLVTSFFAFRQLDLRFRPFREFDLKIIRYQFAFGFPLFINDALATIRTRFDVFVVGIFWNARYVGYYTGAMTLALYALLVPRLFVGSLLVSMSELNAQNDFDRIVRGCYKATRYLILIVTPLVVALIGFSSALMTTIFPQDFDEAVPVLILLAVAFWSEAISYPCTAVLIGINAPRQLTVNTGLTLVILSALLFILIPSLNIIGAGLANLVLIPPHLLLFWQVSRTLTRRGKHTSFLQVFPLRSTIAALVASIIAVAVAGLALFGLQFLFNAVLPDLPFKFVILLVGGLIGGPIYLLSLAFLVRELGPEDWNLVNRIGNLQRFTARFTRKAEALSKSKVD